MLKLINFIGWISHSIANTGLWHRNWKKWIVGWRSWFGKQNWCCQSRGFVSWNWLSQLSSSIGLCRRRFHCRGWWLCWSYYFLWRICKTFGIIINLTRCPNYQFCAKWNYVCLNVTKILGCQRIFIKIEISSHYATHNRCFGSIGNLQ